MTTSIFIVSFAPADDRVGVGGFNWYPLLSLATENYRDEVNESKKSGGTHVVRLLVANDVPDNLTNDQITDWVDSDLDRWEMTELPIKQFIPPPLIRIGFLKMNFPKFSHEAENKHIAPTSGTKANPLNSSPLMRLENKTVKTDVINAILSGLDRGGYDSSQLEYILKALEYNPWIGSDLEEIGFFAQSLITWGTRDSVITVLDDIVDRTVTEITGCTTGEELFNLYLNSGHVDTSHLYEIYLGDDNMYFVCSVI